MNTTRIKVKIIGYYHRDRDMKVTLDLLPKEFNENKKFIDFPRLDVPFVNLNFEVSDSSALELKMESLLEYIRQRPWTNENKPDFVTNKQLLKCIAATFYESIEIHVVRMSGVIFMLKTTVDHVAGVNFGKNFEDFLTKIPDENEEIDEDGIVRKAVFAARIPMDSDDNGRVFKVLYSGEIDAIDKSRNNQHYELKVISGGLNSHFWKFRSCVFYWQSVFSNVPTMIIGSRTGKTPRTIKMNTSSYLPEYRTCDPYSVYKIQKLHVKNIPFETMNNANHPKNYLYEGEPYPRKPDWNVEDCEKTTQEFLKLVNETMKNDGDCFVFSKTNKDAKWIITEDDEKIAPVRECVFKSLNLFN